MPAIELEVYHVPNQPDSGKGTTHLWGHTESRQKSAPSSQSCLRNPEPRQSPNGLEHTLSFEYCRERVRICEADAGILPSGINHY